MKNALLLALPALFAGCASMQYSEYSGPPLHLTSKYTVSNTSFSVPVYNSWPERPYRVVGRIQGGAKDMWWNNSGIKSAARLAKSKGGDALLIHDTLTNATPDVLVLRWKSETELREDNVRLDGLRAYLRRSYPALRIEGKRDLWDQGLEHVAWLGLDIHSQPGGAKLEELLSRLTYGSPAKMEWLFKGTLKEFVTHRPRQQTVYGLATLERTATNTTLVSRSGSFELNFQGAETGDSVRGEMTLVLDSIKLTEPVKLVISPGKMTLEGERNGHRWSFVFLR